VSETPTEPASERVLARARARGDVPFSGDVVFGASVLGGLAAFAYAGSRLVAGWSEFAARAWSGRPPAPTQLSQGLLWPTAWILLGSGAAVGVAVLAQRGATLRLQGQASGAATGARRSTRDPAWVNASLSAFKVLVLTGALALQLRGSLAGVHAAFERDAQELLALSARLLWQLSLRSALVLLALGALELLVQQLLRLRRLRMTRRELRDEQRELAADPRLASERRARSSTPSLSLEAADLVLTGDGRVLALRYVKGRDAAPVLWLKAEAAQAVELVRRAYALGVPLATDALLTDELYRLEAMQPIPAAWSARVASLLARSNLRGTERVA